MNLIKPKIFELMARANSGEAYAQFSVARRYADGRGVRQDWEQAIKWYKIAAQNGSVDAQRDLSCLYMLGHGVERDYQEAYRLLSLLAEQDSWAIYALAGIFEFGYGKPRDLNKAIELYRKAAEMGDPEANGVLGRLYLEGNGIQKDYALAFQHLWTAAIEGNLANAKFLIGRLYREGLGVPKDEREAFIWYREAAAQGYEQAQYILGLAYFHDDIVEDISQDYAAAVEMFRMAAAQGHDKAKYYLAICYDNGFGVQENVAEAERWMKEAADQGCEDAKEALRGA